MGFYSPATIVGDAQAARVSRSGAIDVHGEPVGLHARGEPVMIFGFAVRMGLRYVKGMPGGGGPADRRCAEASPLRIGPGLRAAEPACRARTHAGLAEAGALGEPRPTTRRDALWQVSGLDRGGKDDAAADLGGDVNGGVDVRRRCTKLDEIFWDYIGQRSFDARTSAATHCCVRSCARTAGPMRRRGRGAVGDGQRLEYVGIVICRQQPGTAGGRGVHDARGRDRLRQPRGLGAGVCKDYAHGDPQTTSLLGVTGRLQIQEGVVHLICGADRVACRSCRRPVDGRRQPRLPLS